VVSGRTKRAVFCGGRRGPRGWPSCNRGRSNAECVAVGSGSEPPIEKLAVKAWMPETISASGEKFGRGDSSFCAGHPIGPPGTCQPDGFSFAARFSHRYGRWTFRRTILMSGLTPCRRHAASNFFWRPPAGRNHGSRSFPQTARANLFPRAGFVGAQTAAVRASPRDAVWIAVRRRQSKHMPRAATIASALSSDPTLKNLFWGPSCPGAVCNTDRFSRKSLCIR